MMSSATVLVHICMFFSVKFFDVIPFLYAHLDRLSIISVCTVIILPSLYLVIPYWQSIMYACAVVLLSTYKSTIRHATQSLKISSLLVWWGNLKFLWPVVTLDFCHPQKVSVLLSFFVDLLSVVCVGTIIPLSTVLCMFIVEHF